MNLKNRYSHLNKSQLLYELNELKKTIESKNINSAERYNIIKKCERRIKAINELLIDKETKNTGN
jgi:hypothetical protein